MKRIFASFAFLVFTALAGWAQDRAWVQIEAHPSLREAEERARAYSGAFQDVNAFSLGSGWYAIALGPYTGEAAARRLSDLRRERLVPGDSFVADGSAFRQQIWPAGANALSAPAVAAPAAPAAPEAPAGIVLPDETPAEARRSERLLTAEERRALQEAMQWEGFYTAAIDGAFGRGTRAAMADWQAANGYEVTGVLTTRQRAVLSEGYRDALARLGMQSVDEAEAGIRIDMPAGLVTFSRYEPPFVHFAPKGDSDVRALLISQTGDQATLFGLYDIMQTLEIVPLEGERDRGQNSFVLTGQNETLHSYTYATVSDGTVKGFTLAWPPEDDKLMQKAVQMMRDSFEPVRGVVLDEAQIDPEAEQGFDLLSGLEIRRPEFTRSGFFVDDTGQVLTTTDGLGRCSRITVGDDHEAEIAAIDMKLGLAVLKPRENLAPLGYAAFRTSEPRLKSDVAVAGYSYGAVLTLPALTYGELADLRGLDGEVSRQRLNLSALPGDVGGPVMDAAGAVLGILLPREDGARQLPDEVRFAANVEAIAGFLSANGIAVDAALPDASLPPEDLSTLAADMTVQVSCWE
ncbi:peptidoglycan-binding protein [Rhodovulum iodosum]|nr:peptidoglycan-binding protein [Rhodovulum robiginosum]